ncbi:MAG: RluA family pseudouridine synthase [bacterium]
MEHLTIPEDRVGLELDEFLCLIYPFANKGFLRTQVREAAVLVDGAPAKPGHHLREGEVVSVCFTEADLPRRPVAPGEAVEILHEDASVLVANKPAGLAVEPERWHRDAGCLSGALLQDAVERSDLEGDTMLRFRPRLVHRIDKDTSGALLVAKNLEAERALRAAFDSGGIRKEYLALVEGESPLTDGEWDEINAAIGPDPRKLGRMLVDEQEGKSSCTRIKVEQRFEGYTLMRCQPVTGRTHQIRVHLSWAGFPLMVDTLYGRRGELLLSEIKRNYRPKRGVSERPLMDRLTLHAHSIAWIDPLDGETPCRAEAPLPPDFSRLLKQLSRVRPPREWRS